MGTAEGEKRNKEQKSACRDRYSGVVVITTMAMFMIGNNYFNDILRVQSEFLAPGSETK